MCLIEHQPSKARYLIGYKAVRVRGGKLISQYSNTVVKDGEAKAFTEEEEYLFIFDDCLVGRWSAFRDRREAMAEAVQYMPKPTAVIAVRLKGDLMIGVNFLKQPVIAGRHLTVVEEVVRIK